MSYKLEFKRSALKEWQRLDATLKRQLKNKLAKRLEQPHLPSAKLSGAKNLYKIKLRQSGYRLVYKVEDNTVTVTVVAVGKRERNEVYRKAIARLTN
jgi:mRNA interferase RelE/StbE